MGFAKIDWESRSGFPRRGHTTVEGHECVEKDCVRAQYGESKLCKKHYDIAQYKKAAAAERAKGTG